MNTAMTNLYELTIILESNLSNTDNVNFSYTHYNADSLMSWLTEIEEDDRFYIIGWDLNTYTRTNTELISNAGNSHPINAGAYLHEHLDEEIKLQNERQIEVIENLNK